MDDDPGGTTTIEKEAAQEVAPGQGRRYLSMFDRVKLAQRVAAYRAEAPKKRLSWSQIEEKEGVPASTIRYIYAQWLDSQETMEDPLKIVEETLHLYTEAIEKFALEAQEGDNANARVGATRSMLEAAKGRLELLSAVGKLPRRLGAHQDVADVNRIVHEMAKIIERHNLGAEVIQELLSVVEGSATELPAGD